MRADRIRRAAALVVLVPILLAGCATTPAPADPRPSASAIPADAFSPVMTLILERLDTGSKVAASKWFSGQPVEDPVREKAVLDAAAARAAETGADPAYVSRVFTAQITASKILQEALLSSWRGGRSTPPTTAPDLATQVRPVLDRITAELVPALGAVQRYAADPGCPVAVAATLAAAARPVQPGGEDALGAAIEPLCGTD